MNLNPFTPGCAHKHGFVPAMFEKISPVHTFVSAFACPICGNVRQASRPIFQQVPADPSKNGKEPAK